MPYTICVESSATSFVSSHVGSSGSISSTSSAVETSSECDYYTTITGTNGIGELTLEASCIDFDTVSENPVLSSNSVSDSTLSTRMTSALSSASLCDHYSTIIATNTLGSLTSLVVCADSESTSSLISTPISGTATTTVDASQSATPFVSESNSSRSGSITSSSSVYSLISSSASLSESSGMAMTVSN